MGYSLVNILGGLLIVTSTMVVVSKTIPSAIKWYAIQSVVLVGVLLTLGLTMADIVITLCGMAAVLGLEYYQERGGHVRAALEQKHWLVQWLGILLPLTVILLFGVVLRGDYIPSAFIYQQF